MLKLIVKNITSALGDPWVQGIFGLMLLSRAVDGMTHQISELQNAIQLTHAMGSQVYTDQMNRKEKIGDNNKRASGSVTEFSSHESSHANPE